MAVVDYRARPHQAKALKSDKKYIFMGAGLGAGKTDAGTLWHLMRAKETPPGVLGLIAANSYTQLIDSTIRNVYRNFQRFGVGVEPPEVPRTHQPFNIRVWNGTHWVEILCRSLDSFKLLSGVELGWFWLDEVWQTKKDAIDILVARLRDKRMNNQGLFTTTLDDPSTWMYEMFVENHDPEMTDVIYAKTHDNAKNLPDGYIGHLQKVYTKAMFERMVLAKWVSLEGARIYYAFDREEHIGEEAEFDPNLPVLWTHDFNVGEGKPMSSALCQIKRWAGLDGRIRPELHACDEIVLDTADTHDAANEFMGRNWASNGKVIIYGDASGRARDTRSKTTDYLILSSAGFRNQRVPSANPPIRTRHNVLNALLKSADGDVRFKVHPRCKTLIKGLETVKLKSGAGYLEEETREQHVTAALGYLACREFPMKDTSWQSWAKKKVYVK